MSRPPLPPFTAAGAARQARREVVVNDVPIDEDDRTILGPRS
jgi:nuclear transport factor 2 (NTF2) superfamily protein